MEYFVVNMGGLPSHSICKLCYYLKKCIRSTNVIKCMLNIINYMGN